MAQSIRLLMVTVAMIDGIYNLCLSTPYVLWQLQMGNHESRIIFMPSFPVAMAIENCRDLDNQLDAIVRRLDIQVDI